MTGFYMKCNNGLKWITHTFFLDKQIIRKNYLFAVFLKSTPNPLKNKNFLTKTLKKVNKDSALQNQNKFHEKNSTFIFICLNIKFMSNNKS